jgi:NitT/TauT family transport system permease protein
MQALPLQFQKRYTRHEPLILGTLGLVLFVAAWELAAFRGWLNPVILSSPSRIGEALQRQVGSGELFRDLQVSAMEFVLGFAIAAVLGLVVGLAMGFRRSVEYAIDPFIWFLYSAPLVAFYPLFIIWLGFGFWTVVAITILLTAIPVTINTLAGMRSVDPILVRAVRSYGGSSLDVVFKVILPAALPLILAGFRIAVGRALLGVVVGEMFSANAGLGFRLTYYGARLRTTDLLVPLLVITILGLTLTQLIRALEARMARWRQL